MQRQIDDEHFKIIRVYVVYYDGPISLIEIWYQIYLISKCGFNLCRERVNRGTYARFPSFSARAAVAKAFFHASSRRFAPLKRRAFSFSCSWLFSYYRTVRPILGNDLAVLVQSVLSLKRQEILGSDVKEVSLFHLFGVTESRPVIFICLVSQKTGAILYGGVTKFICLVSQIFLQVRCMFLLLGVTKNMCHCSQLQY